MLQMGSSAGFAMVFALFIAAILWNLGTWLLGLPASSSHTLKGLVSKTPRAKYQGNVTEMRPA
jgi:PiT family inorganic phosphate transporter